MESQKMTQSTQKTKTSDEIMHSQKFSEFFNGASKIMEKMLQSEIIDESAPTEGTEQVFVPPDHYQK